MRGCRPWTLGDGPRFRHSDSAAEPRAENSGWSLVWECHGHQAGAGTAACWPPVPLACFRGIQAAPPWSYPIPRQTAWLGALVCSHTLSRASQANTPHLSMICPGCHCPQARIICPPWNVNKNHSLHQPQVQSPMGTGTSHTSPREKGIAKRQPVEAGL